MTKRSATAMTYITRIITVVACVGLCVAVLGWSSTHLLHAPIPSGLHYSNTQEGDEEDEL